MRWLAERKTPLGLPIALLGHVPRRDYVITSAVPSVTRRTRAAPNHRDHRFVDHDPRPAALLVTRCSSMPQLQPSVSPRGVGTLPCAQPSL